MIGFYVCLGVERTQRYTFRGPVVRIGSADDNELVLRDGDVPEYAATVELRSEVCLVDGKPTADGAELEIGDYMVILALTERPWKRLEVTDDVERRLIDAIVARDEESRLVYADWLEERGQSRRAQFLRIQDAFAAMTSDDPDHHELARRLRLVATLIDVGWRRRIGQPAILGCARSECPKRWSNLDESADPKKRRCEICQQTVTYFTRLEDVPYESARGQRTVYVLDATVRR
jgi:uncharacterized protein (TIGR02996 family)